MELDPENPVVRLCAEGMMLEASDPAAAAACFARAFEARADDVDAAVAAHYVARVQQDAAATRRWNRAALDAALRVEPVERVRALLPSLWLCVARDLEGVDVAAARAAVDAAAEADAAADDGDDAGHAVMIRRGIAALRARLG